MPHTDSEEFEIFRKERIAFYRNRQASIDKIVVDESYDFTSAEIEISKMKGKKNFTQIAEMANFYHFAHKSKFSWRYFALFVQAVLLGDLVHDVRSYVYFVVFGLGDRQIDSPFEMCEVSIKMSVHLNQLAELNPRLKERLIDFLGQHYWDEYLALLKEQRSKLSGEIWIESMVSKKPRYVTEKELGWLKRTCSLSEVKNYLIVIEQDEIVSVIEENSLSGQTWKFSVLNPEFNCMCHSR